MPKADVAALDTEPMITPGSLAKPCKAGADFIKSVANRLGIEPARLANGRTMFSYRQAAAIYKEIAEHRVG